jgi:hypothetical protein
MVERWQEESKKVSRRAGRENQQVRKTNAKGTPGLQMEMALRVASRVVSMSSRDLASTFPTGNCKAKQGRMSQFEHGSESGLLKSTYGGVAVSVEACETRERRSSARNPSKTRRVALNIPL